MIRRSIALDIGGTLLRSGLVDEEGGSEFIRLTSAPNFLRDGAGTPEELRSELVERVEQVVASVEREAGLTSPVPVGVSFPGPINRYGTVLSAPTLWGAEGGTFPLGLRLREKLAPRPVTVVNDVTAAAWFYADRSPFQRFCVVTISSGIGNKVFDRRYPDGVLILDDGTGGEIGHLTIDPSFDATPCDCGGRGHLGAIASGRGVERLARRMAAHAGRSWPDSLLLADLPGGFESITNEDHLVPAIRRGDAFALHILEQATRPLVRSLATLALGIGIEQFIIIGGFALSIGEIYVDVLRRIWREETSYHMARDRARDFFVLGEIGNEAPLRGAGLLALHACSSSVGAREECARQSG